MFGPAVDEIARYLRETGLKRPAVIGHSLGGAAALRLAETAPDSVGSVLIVDALPFYSLLFDPAATPEQVAPMAEAARAQLTAPPPDVFAQMQGQAVAALVKTEAARPRVIGWTTASDRSTVARAVCDVMTADLRPDLGKVSVPVTVLYAFDADAGRPKRWTRCSGAPTRR